MDSTKNETELPKWFYWILIIVWLPFLVCKIWDFKLTDIPMIFVVAFWFLMMVLKALPDSLFEDTITESKLVVYLSWFRKRVFTGACSLVVTPHEIIISHEGGDARFRRDQIKGYERIGPWSGTI